MAFWIREMTRPNRTDHIRLTSHPEPGGKPRFPIHWGAPTARERGPIIGTVSRPGDRNVIGSHGGSYALYRALAVSSGALDPIRRPDLTNTHPAATIGPFAQWTRAGQDRLARSLGPSGRARTSRPRSPRASTSARPSPSPRRGSTCPRCRPRSPPAGSRPTATSCTPTAASSVVKVAIDPVWYLPGIAERFGTHRNVLAPHAVRADRGHVPRAGHAARPARVPAADRRHHGLPVRRRGQARRPARPKSPAGCTTSATAPTCSAPTSAPAAPI